MLPFCSTPTCTVRVQQLCNFNLQTGMHTTRLVDVCCNVGVCALQADLFGKQCLEGLQAGVGCVACHLVHWVTLSTFHLGQCNHMPCTSGAASALLTAEP